MDPHSNYRLRILQDLWRIVVLPSLIFSAIVHAEKLHLGLLRIPAHFVFLVFWTIIKRQWTVLLQHREAQRLAAVPIPCVVGKWPGNIDVLLRLMHNFKTSYILDAYLQLFEEYKCTTLNLRILWIDTIITMDQEHSRFALSTGFQYFWRGKMQKERLETFLGQGIFNRDDAQWKMHRAIARPFFARERISDFEIFEKHTAQTLSILSDLSSSNQACEAQDLFSRFSIDAASEFLFGKNLETLSASLPIPGITKMGPKGSATEDTWGSFVHAFEMSQQEITRRARIGYFWPLFEMFNDRNKVHAKQIQAWLDPLVELALKQKSTTARFGTSPIVDQTFLQRLADSTDDLVLIRDQLLSMLLASRDTTSATLTFITYFMATHPDVAEKMRNEVLSICRVDPPTYEQMRQMKYVRAVINETLRLFPPVPLNTRESRSSCVLPTPDRTYPDGKALFMPKDTTLTFVPLLTQRNAALWGDDADEFKPERWLEPDRLGQFVANPTMYLPFSAGPRICVGQNYAYNQLTYFLVRFLQQFSSCTLAPEYQPEGSVPPPEWKDRKGRQAIEKVWPGNAMTLYIKGGLWIRFHKS
ncbi:cytochrome P450 monooxygenase CYP63 [Amanita muscaria]